MIHDSCSDTLISGEVLPICSQESSEDVESLQNGALQSRLRGSGRSSTCRMHRITAAAISFALLIAGCGFYALKPDGQEVTLDEEMEVTLPSGVYAGEEVPVEVPGFGKAMLAVPPGSKAGEQVVFDVPHSSQKAHISSKPSSLALRGAGVQTFSVTVPKTKLRQVFADVPGVGQVPIPMTVENNLGLYIAFPFHL
jgi:hypothetical protein